MEVPVRHPTRSWLSRAPFVLFGIVGLWFLLKGDHWQGPSRDGVAGDMAWIGFILASFGMATTWRWLPRFGERFTPPGSTLAFCSKALGWVGVALLPWAVWQEAWLVAIAAVAVALTAAGLWLARSWAVWAWYAVATGVCGFALLMLRGIWIVLENPDPLLTGPSYGATAIWAGALLWIGSRMLWELVRVHRQLRRDCSGVSFPRAVS